MKISIISTLREFVQIIINNDFSSWIIIFFKSILVDASFSAFSQMV